MSVYRYCDLCGANLDRRIIHQLDIYTNASNYSLNLELCEDCKDKEIRRYNIVRYELEARLKDESNADNTED